MLLGRCLALCVSTTFLFAYDFSKCQERIRESLYPVGNHHGVAIAPKKLLYFSSSTPPKRFQIIKFDPFLNLYLLKSPKILKPLTLWNRYKLTHKRLLALLNQTHPTKGTIQAWRQGIHRWATFSKPTQKNSVLTGICYHMYGLGIGGNYFYETELIQRFLDSPNVYYGDIGVRLAQNKNTLEVLYVNPFIRNNPFKQGDLITHLDRKKVTKKMFLDQIVDAKKNAHFPITLRRMGKKIETFAYIEDRYGGGFLPDTFLEKFGISINHHLMIQTLKPHAKSTLRWLKKGDKLISIDGMKIVHFSDIKVAFTHTKDPFIKLLFERNGFQFFINLPSEKRYLS
jgi:hypothetical protein